MAFWKRKRSDYTPSHRRGDERGKEAKMKRHPDTLRMDFLIRKARVYENSGYRSAEFDWFEDEDPRENIDAAIEAEWKAK